MATETSWPNGSAATSQERVKKVQNIVTGLDTVPITTQQPPADVEQVIKNAGIPRANIAPSKEKPQGSPERANSKRTVLQQHVDYFDLNGDGVISPYETFVAGDMLGFNLIQAIIGVVAIHFMFSYACSESWIPDPFFRINIKNIHKGVHGSHTGSYDTAGRFVPQKFEDMFARYDKDNKGGLTFKEGVQLIKSNRMCNDFMGWVAALVEASFTWMLLADRKKGCVQKEDLRGIMDGTTFYKIAQRRYSEGKFKRKPPTFTP